MFGYVNRKRNQKGFTLMEMLIVVAIIAILVAVSIPIFTSQLEKSREATDVANMRSAKAEALADYMTNYPNMDGAVWEKGTDNYTAYYDAVDGTLVKAKVAAYGKGTARDAEVDATYSDYDSEVDTTKMIIHVTVFFAGDNEGEVNTEWVSAS